MLSRGSKFQLGLAMAALLVVLTAIGIARKKASFLSRLLSAVPSASSALAFTGPGFDEVGRATSTSTASDRSLLPIDIRLPANSQGRFLLRPAGSEVSVALLLGSVGPSPRDLERGRAIYRSVVRGTDVVAIADSNTFTFSIVLWNEASYPAPSLTFEAWPGELTAELESDKTVTLRLREAAWFVRIGVPLVFGAVEARSTASNELRGFTLGASMPRTPTEFPVVVVWTLELVRSPARMPLASGVRRSVPAPSGFGLAGASQVGSAPPSETKPFAGPDVPPPRSSSLPRSSDELRRLMRDAGLDDGELSPRFVKLLDTPAKPTPVDGVTACTERIEDCWLMHSDPDRCVSNLPRCRSSTPWLGDDARDPCCPDSCLRVYSDERRRGNGGGLANLAILRSHCYPGVREYFRNSAGDAGNR